MKAASAMPLIVRWPKTVKPGTTCKTPVTSTDFDPTLLQACGLDLQPAQHQDGTSFLGLLKNPDASHTREPLFWHYPHWGNQGGIPAAVRAGATTDGSSLGYLYFKIACSS
jgi:arylsulfatase A-like enzyme